jgi:A/G-specific adenine glycosylase
MQGYRHSYAASPIRRLHKRSCTGAAKKSVNMMPNEHRPALTFAPADFQQALLRWYDGARRDLPWRAKPGETPDPYSVWLSEIMLQQTVVKAVTPYFEAFLARWPNADALAEAPLGDVMGAWAGLGYYSRARNLHACAKELARGGFPKTVAGLRELPGIGAYTAAAIAAIAFGQPAAAVDGNVERVIARLYVLAGPLPGAKPRIRALAQALVPRERPGDYAQAMMDLGATVCTPRSPSCGGCPVEGFCLASRAGAPERYPVKAPKAARPVRRGDAFVIVKGDGGDRHILLRRRPEKGLLGGMVEVPGTEWTAIAGDRGAAVSACWIEAQTVRHTFTHFHLEMRVLAAGHAQVSREAQSFGGEWVHVDELPRAALPTVMKKAIAAGFEALGIGARDK